jgi:hypothetical protein
VSCTKPRLRHVFATADQFGAANVNRLQSGTLMSH